MEYDKYLVEGMGYKSCWMVIEGSTQQQIADTFLQKETEHCPYQAGLDKLRQAEYKENLVFVTADYQNTNFVMGISLSKFFDLSDPFVSSLLLVSVCPCLVSVSMICPLVKVVC